MDKSLVKLAFGSVIFCFVAFFVVTYTGASFSSPGEFGDSFGILTSLFTGLGFAGLVLTIRMQQAQMETQQQERVEEVAEKRSLFNLESSIAAYEQARTILELQINDRATWIRAGRLLGHAKALGAGVISDEHKRVLEYHRLEYRTFFSQIIQDRPAAYFYGVQNYTSLTEAAEASTAPESRPGRRHSLSTTHALVEESLHAVWEAGQWPENYIDPIGSKFTEAEKQKLMFHSPGMREFLEHQDTWSSYGGVLSPRPTPAGTRPVDE